MEAVELSGQSVLVTGAYGLLGTWLVKALIEGGATVSVIKRDRTSRSALTTLGLESAINVVTGDICDEGLVARCIAEYEVDSVFHLAAQTIVGTANRSPVSTFETNMRGTWLLLEACRQAGVSRVVVAASDKAYGRHTDLPYREHYALQPTFPYDVSKAATDLISRSYFHTWGLPVAVTRFANLYGGGDANGSRLVPEAITAALAGRSPVVRSDGSPERDFLYVEDAVDAYLAIWDAVGRGPGAGEAFNAGWGQPRRVIDVIEIICGLVGSDVRPDIRGQGVPNGEIDRQWVDCSKLTERTGWRPRFDLEAGLQRTVDWYREHPEWVTGL